MSPLKSSNIPGPHIEVIEIRATPTPEGSEGILAIVFTRSGDDPRPTRNGPLQLTPDFTPIQALFMRLNSGHKIARHYHPLQRRVIEGTSEVLVVMKGKLQVDLYNSAGDQERTVVLCSGDVIILLSGGHGFTMLEDTEIIEIKQGPYDQVKDKMYYDMKA